MLNEEVVREIDALAHQLGTNRSALINQILADYTSVLTPERRIENIFRAMEELVAPARELVPFFVPNAQSMTLKSSLQYKYRPTVKYEVALSRGDSEDLGELSVAFRTQSQGLLESMTYFFRLWKRIEDKHLSLYRTEPPRYALYDGRLDERIAFIRKAFQTMTDGWRDGRADTLAERARRFSDAVEYDDEALEQWISGAGGDL